MNASHNDYRVPLVNPCTSPPREWHALSQEQGKAAAFEPTQGSRQPFGGGSGDPRNTLCNHPGINHLEAQVRFVVLDLGFVLVDDRLMVSAEINLMLI